MIDTLGVLAGLTFMCLKINQWKAIAGFARQTNSNLPVLLYILKYFVQKKTDLIWELGLYEAPSVLEKYFMVENREMLEQAARKGKGAVIVGAHYGPRLYRLMLQKININVRTLVSHGTFRNPKDTSNLGIRFLISKKALFLRNSQHTLASNRSEKEFVRHLRQGGVVGIFIDVPRQHQGGVVTEYFGFPMRFNYFPFKLALRYNAPVFFCFFDKVKDGGYRLCFVPSGDFLTPDEGVKKYATFLHTQITAYPFMWGTLPKFSRWFPKQAGS